MSRIASWAIKEKISAVYLQIAEIFPFKNSDRTE